MVIKKRKSGFGVLEVLISSVIIITILGALVIVAKTATTNLLYLQQRAQAIYLAQEGIEAVREIRDTNGIDKNSATKWNTFLGEESQDGIEKETEYVLMPNLDELGRYRIEVFNQLDSMITLDTTEFSRKIVFYDRGELLPDLPAGDIAYRVKSKVCFRSVYNNEKCAEIYELISNSRQGF